MPLPDQDSAVGHSFALELEGVSLPLLRVADLVLSVFGFARAAGSEPPPPPSRRTVTLVRPLTDSRGFAEWVAEARQAPVGTAARRVAVAVFAADGRPVARYHLENAWPTKHEVTSLTEDGTSFPAERLTVTYDAVRVE